MVVNSGEGRHYPMIKSQSFHGPLSLDCDLNKFCSRYFYTFSSLGEMGRIDGLELSNCSSLQVNKVLVKSFLL